jgi:D-lyxose ketol-isomerase
VFALQPGESITLTPRLYHRFWASKEDGALVCGEVSSVNDDNTDNFFAEPVKRFADIEEDEPPRYLLSNELA